MKKFKSWLLRLLPEDRECRIAFIVFETIGIALLVMNVWKWVVRCKDCLNAMKMPEVVREYFGYREDALDCGMGCGVVLPDDYCSKGCKADAEVEGC